MGKSGAVSGYNEERGKGMDKGTYRTTGHNEDSGKMGTVVKSGKWRKFGEMAELGQGQQGDLMRKVA